jgi:amidase
MEQDGSRPGMGRRQFLGTMALAGGALLPIAATEPRPASRGPHRDLEEATITDLQTAMAAGPLTSLELVRRYRARIEAIDRRGPRLNAVIEENPDAESIAAALDAERRARGARGPLHGIPVLIKDNIDTADRMQTTAGSLALLGSLPARDATMAARLRAAGAVILGKTNLSEWANMRSGRSTSGWSGRGGQTRNPYVLTHDPCGSSSGSAVAVSANLCVAALGTETDGSIVCPSHINGVVGIKPTVGLTSRAGVVPISHNQDTVGPHARTVRDAAILLGALTGVDPRDPATAASDGHSRTDYTPCLDPNGLRGSRIGVARKTFFGYSEHADRVIEAALAVLRAQGATLVDPADLPSIEELATSQAEMVVLLYDLKADLAAYLAGRVSDPSLAGAPVPRTLADLIAFNEAHRTEEMTWFGQELFEQAEGKGPLTDQAYIDALETCRRLGGREGIDAVMDRNRLDALVAPTGGPAWPIDPVNGDHFLGASSSAAAIVGYPLINVPAGDAFGLPIGITFMGRAWSEPTLIRLAYAYEQASQARRAPGYREALDTTP